MSKFCTCQCHRNSTAGQLSNHCQNCAGIMSAPQPQECKCFCHIGYLSNKHRLLTCTHCNRVSQNPEKVSLICRKCGKEHGDIYEEGMAYLCWKEEQGKKPEKKGWEEEMPLYLTSAGDRRRTIHFIKQLLAQQKQEIREKIGQLRQWLNEDRITDPKKMVTNEQIEKWLLEEDK